MDPNNFNRAGDETRAYIMSPLKDNVEESSSNTENDLRYPVKIEQLNDLLTTLVPGIEVGVKGYRPLNYHIKAERLQENQNERGIALFQYDPNSDGNGQRAYRLFYQQALQQENV